VDYIYTLLDFRGGSGSGHVRQITMERTGCRRLPAQSIGSLLIFYFFIAFCFLNVAFFGGKIALSSMIALFCNCREKKEKEETRVGIFQDSLPSRVGKRTAISDRFGRGGGWFGWCVCECV